METPELTDSQARVAAIIALLQTLEPDELETIHAELKQMVE